MIATTRRGAGTATGLTRLLGITTTKRRTRRGYYDYFGSRAGPRNGGYYAYDVASWRVYALNSEFDKVPNLAQMQMDWLRSEFASRPAPCSIAIWHKPLYTSGPNGENPHMRDTFKLLYDNGVDVVLNGHDHIYERFAPQDANGRLDPARGIRQFTVGTGGVAHLHQSARGAEQRENPQRVGRAHAHAEQQFVRVGVHFGRSGVPRQRLRLLSLTRLPLPDLPTRLQLLRVQICLACVLAFAGAAAAQTSTPPDAASRFRAAVTFDQAAAAQTKKPKKKDPVFRWVPHPTLQIGIVQVAAACAPAVRRAPFGDRRRSR